MDARSGLLSWGNGRPIGLVLLSFEAVQSANAVSELAGGISQEQSWAKPFLRYDKAHFYRYYVDSDAFFRDIVRAICGDEAAREIIRTAEVFRRIRSWPPGRLERLLAKIPEKNMQRAVRNVRRVTAVYCRSYFDSIIDDGDDDDLDWPELVKEPSIQFFFQCFVPCYLHFSISPQALFSQATATDRPDLTALRKLVKLDRRVIHHLAVQEVIYHKERATRRRRQDVMSSALRADLPKLSPKTVKERIGGVLSKISEGFGQRISATEIQHLFDLFCRTKSDGRELRDSDLPPSIDAFRKRVDDARSKTQIPGLDGCKL